jgi:deoxycytidylate deaminase
MSDVAEKYETDLSSLDTKYGVMDLPVANNGLSTREKKFLALATKVAEASDVDNKHGAVVVKNGRVLSLGVNKWRNKGLFQESYEPVLTVHAEIDALSRVSDARGAVLYIARVERPKGSKFSRPCWRCMAEIKKAGIKRIIFTVN